MERNEAMRQLGKLFGTMLTAEAPTEINTAVADCSRVMNEWLPGASVTCLVYSSGNFAGPVLHVPADQWRRLQGSQPYQYASVVVVHEADGVLRVVKNRYGTPNGSDSCTLDDIMWLRNETFKFVTSV